MKLLTWSRVANWAGLFGWVGPG